MTSKTHTVLLALPALTLAFAAQAHDPKEHMTNAEAPDCAAMNTMNHGEMDMNDPIVMAMMQQCMSATEHSQDQSEEGSVHGKGQMSDAHMKAESKD